MDMNKVRNANVVPSALRLMDIWCIMVPISESILLELHSPLTNSSGSSHGAYSPSSS